ncbi:MAG TPA: hypothetical protein VG015_01620, partial [Candidatus Dormibacteraeota bacterium]|nr:hypothetical protein [Candidatus Dormibacteraeota bacterium]
MTSIGDAFGLPFKDPNWASKLLPQGLIVAVPTAILLSGVYLVVTSVAGAFSGGGSGFDLAAVSGSGILLLLIGLLATIPASIATTGWMLTTADNYRAGRWELAPAGFHFGRGIGLWGALVMWGIVLEVLGLIPILGILIKLVGWLGFLFLYPSIIVSVQEGGFAAGVNPSTVFARATANPANSVIAGLILLVAGIISVAGFFCFLIPSIFTVPYSYAIMAGVALWFSLQSSASAPGFGGPQQYQPYQPPPPFNPPSAPYQPSEPFQPPPAGTPYQMPPPPPAYQ